MKCIDCIEKDEKSPQEAVGYLVDYEQVRPLCESCYDEYAHMEGDMNLNFFHIEITGVGQYTFIKELNSTLKYLNTMNGKFSDRYFAAKKLGEKWANATSDPHADAFSDPPLNFTLTRKHGQELVEAIKW